MKKIAFLLCLLLLGSTVSCGSTEQETETTAATDPAQTEAETETETETETELLPDIPALDFEGKNFVMLGSGADDTNGEAWMSYDVWVESATGDVINDAVFERNLHIEETYNVTLEQILGITMTLAKQDATAGTGDYDLVFTNIDAATKLAQAGYLVSLYDIPYIDMEKPWWDHGVVEDLALLGDVYFSTGDITVIDNDATWVLMFNKQLHEDNGFESIYDMVREDRWYFDDMLEMMNAATRDANGDGVMTWQEDTYGLCTTADSAQGFFYASGEKVVYKDAEGMPYLTTNTERIAGVVAKSGLLMANPDLTLTSGVTGTADSLRQVFEEGRGLFYGEVLQCVTRMRESDTEFGVLPYPKYDEGQESFHNFVHNTAGKVVAITTAQQDHELAGAITEALAAKSRYTLTPAYYDVALTYKYMRDGESAEMLDIILQDRRYDLGYIYNWGNMYSNLRDMILNGSDAFASTWEKGVKAFDSAMNTALKKYQKLHDR